MSPKYSCPDEDEDQSEANQGPRPDKSTSSSNMGQPDRPFLHRGQALDPSPTRQNVRLRHGPRPDRASLLQDQSLDPSLPDRIVLYYVKSETGAKVNW